MSSLFSREKLVLGATMAVVLLPLVAGGWYVLERHQVAQNQLTQLEPRYARLLGLEAQQADIDVQLARATEARAKYVYPATQDANQTGNVAQQKIREIFAAAGLQIISTQVLPAKEEKGYDRIPMVVRTDGELLALQSVLAVLSSQLPIVVIDSLDIQTQASFVGGDPKAAPRLAVTFGLVVLRERT